MTTKDEALRLALQSLEYYERNELQWDASDKIAIAACRAALAQKDEQEPVAVYVGETWAGSVVRLYEELPLETALYTAPPKRKPMTDERVIHTAIDMGIIDSLNDPVSSIKSDIVKLVRAVEKARCVGVEHWELVGKSRPCPVTIEGVLVTEPTGGEA